MEIRLALLWTGLLLGGQATDILTTALDRARGALESMPVSAHLLDTGGLALLGGTKLLLVVGAASALLLTASWSRRGQPASRITFRLCLVAVQAATLGLAYISLSNIALLSSMPN